MEDIKDTIFKITKTVTKTSGDLLKSTKLTVSLASEEDNLKNIYIDIGKKVHEIYMYGGSLGKFFDEKYAEVDACEQKIRALRDQISEVKGTRSCPSCGKTVDKNNEFCPKCGSKMAAAPVEARSVAAPEIEPEVMPQPDRKSQPAQKFAEPEKHVDEEVKETAKEISAPKSVITCKLCGAENDPGTKFCLSCGRMV